MKILVTGGRDFHQKTFVFFILDMIHHKVTGGITCVVHGGASGADSLASEWCKERGIEEKVYKANWEKYGKAAGVLRNAQMLELETPDFVVAFKGGNGTKHMVETALKNGTAVVDTVNNTILEPTPPEDEGSLF